MSNTITVIGGGFASVSCITQLRSLGYGGKINWVMGEDILPYDRPALSKSLLKGTTQGPPLLLTEDKINGLDVVLQKGVQAVSIDRAKKEVLLDNDNTLNYDKLVLATGGRPRKLPADTSKSIHYLRDLEDAETLKARFTYAKSIIIIGGGWIGLEVAAAASLSGLGVTVLEREERLAARVLPPDISYWLAELHKAHQVNIHTAAIINEIKDLDKTVSVTLADGTVYEADFIVAGIGMIPNDALAAEAGLEVNGGIVTAEDSTTSDPDVYAIGDVARSYLPLFGKNLRLESWEHAQWQGIRLAQKLAEKPVADLPVPWFWSDQYDCNVQMLGIHFQGEPVVRDYGSQNSWIRFYLNEGNQIEGAISANAGREMRGIRKLMQARRALTKEELSDLSINLNKL